MNFRRVAAKRILERYGMSEAGMICSNPLDGERRGGSVGFALPGVSLRIAAEHDEPLPRGEIGGIQIQGENVFAGYWRMPEKTREEFTADGYFRTGDVGVVDSEGYVSIVGRAKDLIISGGYNVYPKEIELALDALPGVTESAVIGIPHPDFGEAVAAVIVASKDANIDPATVIAELKKNLANYKVPKRIYVVDDLPRNAMGKVQKALLRERYGKSTWCRMTRCQCYLEAGGAARTSMDPRGIGGQAGIVGAVRMESHWPHSPNLTILIRLADGLAEKGWAVFDEFFAQETTAALRSDCRMSDRLRGFPRGGGGQWRAASDSSRWFEVTKSSGCSNARIAASRQTPCLFDCPSNNCGLR